MFSSCSSSPLPAPPLVFDLGVHTFRAGISGDVLPRWIAPSVVGCAHGEVASSFFSSSSSFFSSSTASERGDGRRGAEGRGMLLAPLNPLEKRDHLDVYPIVSCSLHPRHCPAVGESLHHPTGPHVKTEKEEERFNIGRLKEEEDERQRPKSLQRDGRTCTSPTSDGHAHHYSASGGCGGVYYDVDIPVRYGDLHFCICAQRKLSSTSFVTSSHRECIFSARAPRCTLIAALCACPKETQKTRRKRTRGRKAKMRRCSCLFFE